MLRRLRARRRHRRRPQDGRSGSLGRAPGARAGGRLTPEAPAAVPGSGRSGWRPDLLLALAILALGLVLWAGGVRSLWNTIVIDDAYISYRYAENWATGHGPNWNADGSRAEGYSTPLYVALLAGTHRATGLPIPGISRALGIASALGLLAVVFLLARSLTGRTAWGIGAAGIVAAHPCLAVWTVGGMETGLYAALLTASAVTLHRVLEHDSRAAWGTLAVCLALVGLCRTEGVALAAAFGLAALLASRGGRGLPGRRAVVALSGAGLCLVAHLIVRRLYYGLWFPLPMYEKGLPWAGTPLVLGFFAAYGVHLVAGLYGALDTRDRRTRVVLAASGGAGLLLSLVLLHVYPIMSAYQRFVFPVVPLVLVAAVHGIHRACTRVGVFPLAGVLVTGLAAPAWLLGAHRGATLADVLADSRGMEESHLALGRWLAARVPDRTALLAVSDCGLIPFHSKLPVLDMYGLNSPEIARGSDRAAFVFGRRPDLLVVSPLGGERAVRRDPRLATDYELVGTWDGHYVLQLFRRRDTARVPAAALVDESRHRFREVVPGPEPPTALPAGQVSLTELTPLSVRCARTPARNGVDGRPLSLGGAVRERGLALWAPCLVAYGVPPGEPELRARIGLPDGSPTCASGLRFEVRDAFGKRLYGSAPLRPGDLPVDIAVKPGATAVVYLSVEADAGSSCGPGAWVDPVFAPPAPPAP